MHRIDRREFMDLYGEDLSYKIINTYIHLMQTIGSLGLGEYETAFYYQMVILAEKCNIKQIRYLDKKENMDV